MRSANAHPATRVLPQLLGRVQAAERARDGAEIECREALRDVGIVKRLLRDRVENFPAKATTSISSPAFPAASDLPLT